ncbi:MAG: hypothetical protein ABW170_08155 [Candidatus Thiodiazotropha sp. L084R]
MTRTAGALIGRRRSSAFWGLGCPKTHHEIKDSLVLLASYQCVDYFCRSTLVLEPQIGLYKDLDYCSFYLNRRSAYLAFYAVVRFD